MSKSAWIHIIFDNACSTQGLWLDKIGWSENFLIFICYLGPLVHSVIALSVCHYIPQAQALGKFQLCHVSCIL